MRAFSGLIQASQVDLTRYLGHMSRQGEMKGGSSSIVGGRPQPAAMRLHNGTANGQSHAAALRLGGKERRKDLFHLLLRQPHASVTDGEEQLTVLQFRLHSKLSAAVLHGFDGVEHKVHEHLLQLHAIRGDSWQFSGKFRAHGNRVSSGLTLHQREHFLDNSVQVDQLASWRRLRIEGAYTVDDLSRTITIPIDS